jgi:predicted nucleic acid-binding protein
VKSANKEKHEPWNAEELSHPYLLDTSALLSFIEDEPGADRVELALKQKKTLIPWTVLLEMYYITYQEEGVAEADRRISLMKELPIQILWDMDETMVLTAGKLKAEHRISLADAIIAAFAIRRDAVLMHKDPEYDALFGILAMESLPYKSDGD